MPKDKSVNKKSSFDKTKASPYDRSKKVSGGSDSSNSWEEVRCPICMEHPHNAVELRCSSRDKGCCPFMCNTSYRHSNCLDLFRKSSWSSEERTYVLVCPLCRGTITRSNVNQEARKFMDSKTRSCSLETCDFTGNYAELRKHARLEHPAHRPSVASPTRKSNWLALEQERDREDMLAHQFADYPSVASPTRDLNWVDLEQERYRQDTLAHLFADYYPNLDDMSTPDFSTDLRSLYSSDDPNSDDIPDFWSDDPNLDDIPDFWIDDSDDIPDLWSDLESLYSSDDNGDSSSDFSIGSLNFVHDNVSEDMFSYASVSLSRTFASEQALEVPTDRGENSLISRSGNHRESGSSGLRAGATYRARRESGSRTYPRLRSSNTRDNAYPSSSARSTNYRENVPASSSRSSHPRVNRDLVPIGISRVENLSRSISGNGREGVSSGLRAGTTHRVRRESSSRTSPRLRSSGTRNSANINLSERARNYRENIPASSRSRWSSARWENDEPNRVTRIRSGDLRLSDMRNSINMNSSTRSRNYRENIPASSRSRWWSNDRIENDEPNRVTRLRSDDIRLSGTRNRDNINSSSRSRNYRENIPSSSRSRWSSDRWESDDQIE